MVRLPQDRSFTQNLTDFGSLDQFVDLCSRKSIITTFTAPNGVRENKDGGLDVKVHFSSKITTGTVRIAETGITTFTKGEKEIISFLATKTGTSIVGCDDINAVKKFNKAGITTLIYLDAVLAIIGDGLLSWSDAENTYSNMGTAKLNNFTSVREYYYANKQAVENKFNKLTFKTP